MSARVQVRRAPCFPCLIEELMGKRHSCPPSHLRQPLPWIVAVDDQLVADHPTFQLALDDALARAKVTA